MALSGTLVAGWVAQLLISFVGYALWLSPALRWMPAVIVGVALAWCGVRPWGRLVVWAIGLVVLWVMPTVAAVLSYALNIPALQSDPQGLLYGIMSQIVPEMLRQSVAPVVVALAIGVVGTAVRILVASRCISSAATPPDA